MPYYATTYVGAGTKSNPFRPTGSDQAGWSAIDLRADKGATLDGGGFGYALLWLPPGSSDPVGSTTLGVALLDTATTQVKTFLSNKTGLDFSADVTVQDVFEHLLVSPPIGWWNALRPAHGRVEAWLGGQRIVDFPVLAGGSISDNFNRANETPLAAPWTKNGTGSGVNLSSNAITKTVADDSLWYYSGSWNNDQSSQFQYVTAVTNGDWGPAVRIGTGTVLNGYFYDQATSGRVLYKFVAGTGSLIEAASGAGGTGVPYKLDVAGSTLSYYDNGSANANSPGTDTSLTSGAPGLFYYDTGGSLDDFLATGEITKSLPFAAASMKHLLVR